MRKTFLKSTTGLDLGKEIGEAVPKIEAAGGRVLVQGVEAENEKMLHLIMETPDAETVAAFMSDEQFTADRIAAGVHVETTKVTFLKD